MTDQASIETFKEKFPLDLFSSYDAFEQLAEEWAQQNQNIAILEADRSRLLFFLSAFIEQQNGDFKKSNLLQAEMPTDESMLNIELVKQIIDSAIKNTQD